jgi:eukaryotic-like serine/threonine-protein kinase
LAQLAHPRIVEVYDYGIDDVGPYYTMELLDGGDLQQLAPIDPLRLCAIARDVCSALALIHSRRVLHRDVSPRNIRCRPDGTARS